MRARAASMNGFSSSALRAAWARCRSWNAGSTREPNSSSEAHTSS
jgi:hypothetical protein